MEIKSYTFEEQAELVTDFLTLRRRYFDARSKLAAAGKELNDALLITEESNLIAVPSSDGKGSWIIQATSAGHPYPNWESAFIINHTSDLTVTQHMYDDYGC
jgi:hypothetical protein